MDRSSVFFIVVFLIILGIIGTALSENDSANYHANPKNQNYLENLKVRANLDCLQNSQCSTGQECVKNKCRDDIDVCKEVKLSTSISKLRVGSPLNADKDVITKSELPDLLANGEIVEVVDSEVIEHFYRQFILIGNSTIEEENGESFIKQKSNSDESIYTFKLSFSKGIDFSSENIQGQVLRILGREYIIGDASSNKVIYLISNNRALKLQDGEEAGIGSNSISARGTSTKIVRDDEGNVVVFEIAFNKEGKDKSSIRIGEDYTDTAFNDFKLSFNSADSEGVPYITLGGNC